jgi:type IV secretory pathway VirD2 relaxase/predicted DNA-binding WGR domain protein
MERIEKKAKIFGRQDKSSVPQAVPSGCLHIVFLGDRFWNRPELRDSWGRSDAVLGIWPASRFIWPSIGVVAMTDDTKFTPRLGRIRAKGGKKAKRFLHQVLAATALAGGVAGKKKSGYTGARLGRGASVARIMASHDRLSGYRSRRGIIKARIVRLGGKELANAHAHLRYVERDGTTCDGEPAQLYSRDSDDADGKAFLERGQGDRHQFRFIVSAEDGDQYDDLKLITRRLMVQVEKDLDTKLDWVAVDHFNTGHPHSHIILRGVDDRGKDLIIARDYLGVGMRSRFEQIIERDLGPRTTLEIENRLRHDISAERATSTDRALLRDMDGERVVTSQHRDPVFQSMHAGRLHKLEQLGLASDMGGGRWRLTEELDVKLRALGERGDIIKALNRTLKAKGLDRPPSTQRLHILPGSIDRPITGRIVARGLSDEYRDRHYLIVDGTDGQVHYVDIGKGDTVAPIPKDSIVEITPRTSGVRVVDQTIAAVAAANEGRYDIDEHLAHDPSASERFAESHVRRLEAMRRAGSGVERAADGSWTIAPDHLERVSVYEAKLAQDRPVIVNALSSLSLDAQRQFNGATWLDQELVRDAQTSVYNAGFGKEVKAALTQRRRWLMSQGLGEKGEFGLWKPSPKLLDTLRRRELLRVAGQLSGELGLNFVESRNGDRIEGTIKRHVDLAQGRFALIEKSREFILVPWRDVLEKQIGKQVGGIMRDSGVSWTIGRGRGGPTIS